MPPDIIKSTPIPRKREDIKERFFKFVDKTDTCWNWTGAITSHGYGYVRGADQSHQSAHRVSYKMHVGDIPEGLVIDHLCRNRACVNPGHLEVVTNKVNLARGCGIAAKNAKKEQCKEGHPLSGGNVRMIKLYNTKPYTLARRCKQCEYRNVKAYRRKKELLQGNVTAESCKNP